MKESQTANPEQRVRDTQSKATARSEARGTITPITPAMQQKAEKVLKTMDTSRDHSQQREQQHLHNRDRVQTR